MNADTIGGSLQILGVIVTAWGALRAWREFAPDESVLEPIIKWTRDTSAALVAVSSRLWRRLRGRRAGQVVGASVAITGAGSVSARGRVGYGPLPDDIELPEALRRLDERTRGLMDRVEDVRERLEDSDKAILAEVAEVRARLESHVVRLDVQGRRAATGGVRVALVGAVLIVLGLGIQTFG
jgi:hypothetical protein